MNKTGSAAKVKLNSFDDLFGDGQPQAGIEQVQEIALSELHEFKGHPFKVLDDEKMQETVESVREHGVLMPGIARPRAEGGYEIIAGHRRRHACELVGLETMPMFIRDYTDDEATIIMVDSNIQREDILPSEKAKAYRMKYDAMKHQGSRTGGLTLEELGETAGESAKTVQRYIWISRLSEPLLDMVDLGKIQYLGGEAPSSISEIVKFGLFEEEGNFTYIVLKLQSDYNLAYNGMIFLLCLFSLFVVYSVFSISVSKRTSEYGILQTLGISEAQIGGTLLLELWTLFFIGYPLGCLLGNGVLSLMYQKFSGVFGGKGISGAGNGLSVADHTLAEGENTVEFFVSKEAVVFGFVFLLISLALVAFLVVRSMRKDSLKTVMSGDTSFVKRRKIYAMRNVNMANVVVRKFMFANKRKVIGILLSLSIGGCIFLCTTYMVENLKVHAELSLISDDGLGSEYRISLKSDSLKDTIPEAVADKIKNMPETENVYATKYTMGELQISKNEFLSEEEWSDYFKYQNQEPYYIQRYDGICKQQEDGNYRIKYNVYGYDEAMIEQLRDFILEGEIQPETIKNNNQVIVTANMDGQGNYFFYGKKPGDTITLRVPKTENYTDELLKFQSGEENYIEKEFEIAAIVNRPLAQEKDFLNTEVWKNAQSVIMTGEQMEENFGITDYSFINASPADSADAKIVSNQLLQVIRDVPKAVLQDYTTAIATQKGYLGQQQIFFSSIAVILLIISLFHIVNSMSHTILTRRREYGIIRAIGITDGGFYKMILQTGILYGLLADVFIYLIYNRVLRRVMNYYLAHVLQFLHYTTNIPNLVLNGIMVLNVVIAVVAVMFPAWKMGKENIISEIRR